VENHTLESKGTLLYKNKIYVPNVQDLKLMTLNEVHNVPCAGHPAYQKTMATVKSHYFWPGMKKEIAEYIARRLKLSIDTQQGCYSLYPFLSGSGR
jgi:hypothetical protein